MDPTSPPDPVTADRDPAVPGGPTPPVEIRADAPMDAASVRAALTDPALPDVLDRLGITGIDRDELLAVIPAAVADDALLAATTEIANLLRARTGLDAPPAALGARTAADDAAQHGVLPGRGLAAILGHLAATDTVLRWHGARGIPPEMTWAALADLGQQMRVHRRVFGGLGHHTVDWTAMVWTGRLLWLDRLQFDLHRAPGTGAWEVGTHIPATGPLDPDAADASFARAAEVLPAHFADLDPAAERSAPVLGREFVCRSWLISRELETILGPEANLSRFAARWRIEDTYDGSDDAVFFVFGVRPPYRADALPTDTRLRRAIRRELVEGRGWRGGMGRLRT